MLFQSHLRKLAFCSPLPPLVLTSLTLPLSTISFGQEGLSVAFIYCAFKQGCVYCVREKSPYEHPSHVIFTRSSYFSESFKFTGCHVFDHVFKNSRVFSFSLSNNMSGENGKSQQSNLVISLFFYFSYVTSLSIQWFLDTKGNVSQVS